MPLSMPWAALQSLCESDPQFVASPEALDAPPMMVSTRVVQQRSRQA